MDIISFNEAATANGRIEKFNANPDSNSGVLTQPKVIEAGETVTIKSGRQAVLADTVIDGDLIIEAGGDVFIPAGSGFGVLDQRIDTLDNTTVKLTGDQTIEDVKTFTSSPIVPTPTTEDDAVNKDYVDGKYSGFKNYIINGDFKVNQHNSNTVVDITGGGVFPCDRFFGLGTQPGKITAQIRVSGAVPMGHAKFEKCLQVMTVSGYSPNSGENFGIVQKIEGLSTANLRFGSIRAKTITLSFWVRSSVIGLHSVSFKNSENNRCYVATYTINSADTFEYKTITIQGDTTGTWVYDNGVGLGVFFSMASGSSFSTPTPNQWVSGNFNTTTGCVNDIATTGNNFYITGVQLEEGSVATPFEQRPIGLELSLCKRYYEKGRAAAIAYAGSGSAPQRGYVTYSTEKRLVPSAILTKTIGDTTGGTIVLGDATGFSFGYASTGAGQEWVGTYTAIAEL